jgi:hypothetical protein
MDDSLPIPYHPKKPQQNLPEIEGHQDLRLDLQLARHMTWPMSIDFHPTHRMVFMENLMENPMEKMIEMIFHG